MNPFEQYRGINPLTTFFYLRKHGGVAAKKRYPGVKSNLRHADEIKEKKARIKEKGMI